MALLLKAGVTRRGSRTGRPNGPTKTQLLQCKQVNDLLLQKLVKAKNAYESKSNTELLDVPAVSTLVNTLIIVNEPWITKAIARTIRQQPQLLRSSVEELHSTALTGNSTQQGTVGGVMNAILEYDYPKYGVSSFTPYLARTISNTLQPTSHQKKAYQRCTHGSGRFRASTRQNRDGSTVSQPRHHRHLLPPSTMTCWKSSAT